jgi:hypothetical protein
MFQPKKVALSCLLIFMFGPIAWSQSSPALSTSYVSGGESVFQVSGTTVTAVLTLPGSNFESISIGPDNVDQNGAGNAAHPFLIYACDTTLHRIVRFDPANSALKDIFATGTIVPVCGRSSAAGDFFITNKAGSGVWKLAGVASQFLGSSQTITPAPITASFPAAMTGGGITQKNVGDLLVVDKAENKVLRSPYGTSPNNFITLTQSPFASSNLSAPVGIARFSNGDVFVANSVPGSGSDGALVVTHYNSSGTAGSPCPVLSLKTNQTPQFLASAENDVLYLVTQANSSGTVSTWDATQTACTMTERATVHASVSGIAVGPVPTEALSAQLTATSQNPAPHTFMFNSNAFQIVASGCTATVTAHPISPATVKGMITQSGNTLPSGASAATNLGEGGYSVAYVAKWTGCQSVFPDGAFVTSIYGLFDNSIVNNPRIIQCEGESQEPLLPASSCFAADTIGDYPLGGIIPLDLGTTIKSPTNSTFVLANANSGAATFCGFQSPLVNTTDPSLAAAFSAGKKNTLSIKFKMAAPSGNCQSGPFVTNAKALISVARLTDGAGNDAFQPIAINSTSIGLADAQPLFNTGNQQYQFTLEIQGYALGVYSLTATLLSDNTSSKTILFRIIN